MTFIDALDAAEPRIICFTSDQTIVVGGTHYINNVAQSNVIIDGNGYNVWLDNTVLIFDGIHDVTIKNIRFTNQAGVQFRNCYNFRIMHCYFEDTIDPSKPITGNTGSYNGEIAGNIFSDNDYGLLFYNCKNISIHHNLFMHNVERNPKCGDSTDDPEQLVGDRLYEIKNNVVYDWENYSIGVAGMSQADVVANMLIPGNDLLHVERGDAVLMQFVQDRKMYIVQNVGRINPDGIKDNWLMTTDLSGAMPALDNRSAIPLTDTSLITTSAHAALGDVVAYVGPVNRGLTETSLINILQEQYTIWRNKIH